MYTILNKHRQEICTPKYPSNGHNHLNYYCIQAAELLYCDINISIPDDVKRKLKQTHEDFVLNQIGLNGFVFEIIIVSLMEGQLVYYH